MTPVLHEHPFAAYCWKALIAFYECDVAFERVFVGDAADRQRLATLWPVGSIPVLVDGERVLGESTTIVEHMHIGAAELVPPRPALDARLWDRVIDGQVMTPMQKIVADSLRPEDARDPYGVEEARGTLERAYALLEQQSATSGSPGRRSASPTARPPRRCSTPASCTAGTRPRCPV